MKTKFEVNISFDEYDISHVSSKQPLEQSLIDFFKEFPPYYDSLDICGQFDGKYVEINTCKSFNQTLLYEDVISLLYETGYSELKWSINLKKNEKII